MALTLASGSIIMPSVKWTPFIDPLCRLAENLKVADDCVLERTRRKDGISARR